MRLPLDGAALELELRLGAAGHLDLEPLQPLPELAPAECAASELG